MRCPRCGGWMRYWEIETRAGTEAFYVCRSCHAEVDWPADRLEPWESEIEDALREEARKGRRGAIREE